MEPAIELVEKLEVFVENISNLVDARMEIGFHDYLVEFEMEIVEDLVMDDLVGVGDELCVVERLL